MPKVLRIINRLNLGGPTFNASYLTKYLVPDFETMLVAGMKGKSEASSEFIPNALGIKPSYIRNMHRSINFKNDYDAYRQIKSIIKSFKPDIVHTHAAKAGTLGRLAAINSKVPVVLHTFHGHVFHSYFGKAKAKLFIEIERYLAKRTSGIIAISNKQKDELCDQFKITTRAKTHVVPLGFDLEKFRTNIDQKRQGFRAKYNFSDTHKVICIIGRLVPIKNHHLFFDAFKHLKTRHPNIKALVVGDGELRSSLENYCIEQNLQLGSSAELADVIFTSWIKEIDEVCAGADIIALTSKNEGTPVSVIEALAAAKPVVSTKVGGIEDLIKHGHSGLLSPPNLLEGLQKNLDFALLNTDQMCQMGVKGQEHILEKYSYQRLVADIKCLYTKLLS